MAATPVAPVWQVLAGPLAIVIAASITGFVAWKALQENSRQHAAQLAHDRRMRWIDEARAPLIDALRLLREGTEALLTLRRIAVALEQNSAGDGLTAARDAVFELDERFRATTAEMLIRFSPESDVAGPLLLAGRYFTEACTAVAPDGFPPSDKGPLTRIAEASHSYWDQHQRFETAARTLVSAEAASV